jgi:hypothetical protein
MWRGQQQQQQQSKHLILSPDCRSKLETTAVMVWASCKKEEAAAAYDDELLP